MPWITASANSRPEKNPHSDVNVHEFERIGSALLGGGLAAFGLGRGGCSRLATGGRRRGLVYRGVSGHCMVYDQLGINTAEGPARCSHHTRQERSTRGTFRNHPPRGRGAVRRLAALQRPARFHDAPAKRRGAQRSAQPLDREGPLGTKVSWEAEIIEDHPGELISWRSVEGSLVDTAGRVHFEPSGNGSSTQVTVNLKYNPPAGKAGAKIAQLLGAIRISKSLTTSSASRRSWSWKKHGPAWAPDSIRRPGRPSGRIGLG